MAVAGPRDLILQVLLLHPPVSPLGRELAAARSLDLIPPPPMAPRPCARNIVGDGKYLTALLNIHLLL